MSRVIECWSAEEIAYLSLVYPDVTTGRDDLLRGLPGRTWRAIGSKANSMGLKRQLFMQYSVIPYYFDVIDNVEKAYYLGLMAADGYTTVRNGVGLKLHPKDRRLVEMFLPHLSPDYEIKDYSPTSSGFELYNTHLHTTLQSYGIVPHKHLSLRWPDVVPDHLTAPFILGMFDGDGCLSWELDVSSAKGGFWRWTLLASELMLWDVRDQLLGLVDVRVSEPKKMSSGNVYFIRINGRAVSTVDDLMSHYPIGLSRKRIHGHPHTIAMSPDHDVDGI